MQLDDAYTNAAYIPDADSYPPRWARKAATFRQALGPRAELGVQYGPSPRQAYDFFHADGASKGTLVFVHGGYWLKFDRSSWSHLAEGGLAQGWNVVMVEYDLCPQVRIAEITDQIARAVEHVAARTEGALSLVGHSAGGHLVARMLAPGKLGAKVLARVHAVAPISPLSDLRPLLQTSMNDAFQLDISSAAAESPVMQPAPETNVRIWVGAKERPAFLEQAAALASAWAKNQVVVPGRHHFDVIDALEDTASDLTTFLTEARA